MSIFCLDGVVVVVVIVVSANDEQMLSRSGNTFSGCARNFNPNMGARRSSHIDCVME